MNTPEQDQALHQQCEQARAEFERTKARVAELQREYTGLAAARVEIDDVEAHIVRGNAAQDAIAEAEKTMRHARERYRTLDHLLQPAIKRARSQHAASLRDEISAAQATIDALERRRPALLDQIRGDEAAAETHRQRIAGIQKEINRIQPRPSVAVPHVLPMMADPDVPPPGVLLSVRAWAEFLERARAQQLVDVTALVDETNGTISLKQPV